MSDVQDAVWLWRKPGHHLVPSRSRERGERSRKTHRETGINPPALEGWLTATHLASGPLQVLPQQSLRLVRDHVALRQVVFSRSVELAHKLSQTRLRVPSQPAGGGGQFSASQSRRYRRSPQPTREQRRPNHANVRALLLEFSPALPMRNITHAHTGVGIIAERLSARQLILQHALCRCI